MNKSNHFHDITEEAILYSKEKHNKNRIIIGYGTCGIAAGAEEVLKEVQQVLHELKIEDVIIEKTGCIGCCSYEPLMDIELANSPRVSYKNVKPKEVKEIIDKHFEGELKKEKVFCMFDEQENIIQNQESWKYNIPEIYSGLPTFKSLPMLKKQKRITLRNVGIIDPENINDYLARGGYQALYKTLTALSPKEVIDEIKSSGLRGRGGAGFPTGVKWEFAYNAELSKTTEDSIEKTEKYVVCNADEGDPGAFMDRSLIEGDPHSVIEGLTIAAYAIGATKGFIYIRAEYPLAIKRLEIALKQAYENHFLGDNIFGTDFHFSIEIRKGAGAFVCGEETALINSIMGLRGEPRPRPPYPAVSGLWGKPTIINNVKTLVTVPVILLNGAKWFSSIGTEDTKGTAVFALTGDVKNSGLVEVPMGTTLREIIFDIGGGVKGNKQFKAVQTGGPSGGCIPFSLIDTPVDFASLKKLGSIMGSGGMIVCSESTCMVDLARYFMTFIASESCGKCTPCREGTVRALEMLEKITSGDATIDILTDLEQLSLVIKDTALCGLGQTAPNPILSTLKYFKEEYIEHIEQKVCRAKVCPGLFNYVINDDLCIKCGVCQNVCPVDAVFGSKETGFFIENRLCISCNACFERCPKRAIEKVN
ncbi:MAG: NADH-quinone oxidoreductase subunit NuoF [Candidatus Heimdallarchaeum endolithica]|uniref:NADH-quinone oxidoreductase subunit NuoF n=1 Tax=Candidatus Heimdallarchaeum endolithica TaxID=2876572 RepID=A0A9Y1BPK7_9ARCH|nr:MAG: NADH-quinone oxidoreductase subunit NuoF [Candidatus Heimdallarchaeum endolithica]